MSDNHVAPVFDRRLHELRLCPQEHRMGGCIARYVSGSVWVPSRFLGASRAVRGRDFGRFGVVLSCILHGIQSGVA